MSTHQIERYPQESSAAFPSSVADVLGQVPLRFEENRGQALQDLQRPAPPLERPARRHRRNQPPRRPGRLLHHAGQLQLNPFEPIIAHSLFEGIQHLTAGCRTLNERCVRGITANVDRARRLLDESTALVTALNPHIGYARSSEIAQEALRTGAKVYDLVVSKGYMTREQLNEVLKPEVLTQPHFSTIHKPRSEPE